MLYLFLVIGTILGVAHSSDPELLAKYEDVAAPDAKYNIEDKNIGDLRTKVLMNTYNGEYVQIVTDLGGRIEDLVLRGSDKKLRSVLLTHNNNSADIKKNAWWKNAILLPYANRIDG